MSFSLSQGDVCQPVSGPLVADQHVALSPPIVSYVNTLKSIVGAGVIALPYACKRTGWLLGVVSLLLVALLSDYTMGQLVSTNQQFRRLGLRGGHSFRDIGTAACGQAGTVLADVSLTLCQFGAGCSFLAFTANNLADVVATDASAHAQARQVVLVCAAGVVLVLTLLRSTTFLAPAAWLGNFCFLAAVMGVWIIGFSDHPPSLRGKVAVNFAGLPAFFGIACFAFSAHPQVVVLEQAARDRAHYARVLDAAVVSAMVAFAAFGSLGYLFFGEDTEDIIFLNLGHGSLATLVKVCISVMVVFNYPFSMVPLVESIEQALQCPTKPPVLAYFVDCRRAMIRALVVMGTLLVAALVHDFGFLTAVVGSFANGLVAFVLPPLFYVGMSWGTGEKSKATLYANVLLALCGTVFSFGSAGIIIANKAQDI